MELRLLQYFLAVAREENITRAAEVLHITQPTLSRQLVQLEEEVGVQLLPRLILTPALCVGTEAMLNPRRQPSAVTGATNSGIQVKKQELSRNANLCISAQLQLIWS